MPLEEPTTTVAAPATEPTGTSGTPDTTPAAPPPPAAASEPPEPPPWLSGVPDSAGAPVGGFEPQFPQAQPQAPGYPVGYPPAGYPQGPGYPPPPPSTPFPGTRPVTVDDLGRDIDGTLRGVSRAEARAEIAAALGPLVGRLMQQEGRTAQLDAFGRQQHEANTVRAYYQAKAVALQAWQEAASSEPALRDKTVQKYMDEETKGFLRDRFLAALVNGDFSGLQQATNPIEYQTLLYRSKLRAGWDDRAQRIQVRGAFLESSRPQPLSSIDLASKLGIDSNELAEVLRQTGLTIEEFAEQAGFNKKGGAR